MCELVKTSNGVSVAAIKKTYIDNIIDNANSCKDLDKIILFGSSIRTNCTEESDIDIAVFSKVAQAKFLASKSFRDFMKKVYVYDFGQSYDVLFFKSDRDYKEPIFDEVMKGSVIYGN